VRVIPQIVGHGFESFSLTFWQSTGQTDLVETAKRVRELAEEHDFVISTVGVFGNPLTGTNGNEDTLASWERLIDHAHLFGADIVSGFTGRLTGESIDASIPKFEQVFGELSRRAADRGVRIAFENCDMGGTWASGDWNIAHNPTAWEKMFNAV
ncbi:TIM barrel protein, partial [Paenibacillus sp. MCAF20]